MSESEESSDEEWPKAETPKEAIEIFSETVFDFADIILRLSLKAEKTSKFNGVKPSVKIKVITGLLKLFNHERLIEHYVNFVLNWKPYIDERDATFFLENDHIYPGAPKADVEFFRNLWRPTSKFHLNKKEKEIVFEYFDTMLHYCEEWKVMTNYIAKWEGECESSDSTDS